MVRSAKILSALLCSLLVISCSTKKEKDASQKSENLDDAGALSSGRLNPYERPGVKQRLTVQKKNFSASDMAFSSDGSLLATANDDGLIDLWEPSTGQIIRQIDAGKPSVIAFSPDSKLIASATSYYVEGGIIDEINLWDVSTGECRKTIKNAHLPKSEYEHIDYNYIKWGVYLPTDIAFSPDGEFIALGNFDGQIEIIDNNSGDVRWVGDRISSNIFEERYYSSIDKIIISANGKLLITAGEYVKLWEAVAGDMLASIKPEGIPLDVGLTREEDMLVVSCKVNDTTSSLSYYEVPSGKKIRTIFDHSNVIFSSLGPNCQTIAQYVEKGESIVLRLGYLTSSEFDTLEIVPRKVYCDSVPGLGLAQSNLYLIGFDKLWKISTRKPIWSFDDHDIQVNSKRVTPNDDFLLLENEKTIFKETEEEIFKGAFCTGVFVKDKLMAYNIKQGNIVVLTESAYRDYLVSPDDSRIAIILEDGQIDIIDLETGTITATLKGNAKDSQLLGFILEDNIVITGRQDGVIDLWDMSSSASLLTIQTKSDFILGPPKLSNGKNVLVTTSWFEKLSIWDLSDGKLIDSKDMQEISTLPDLSTFSPDGKKGERVWGQGSSGAGVFCVIDTFSGEELICRYCPSHGLSFAFSPDSSKIAICDDSIDIYDISVENPTRLKDFEDEEQGNLGRLIVSIEEVTVFSVDFSPDSEQIAAITGNGEILIYNSTNGSLANSFKGLRPRMGEVDESFRYVLNGKALMYEAIDQWIVFYNPSTGDLLCKLYLFEDGWAILGPDGSIDFSENVKDDLTWTVGNTIYPLDEYLGKYHRPGLYRKIIRD